MTGCFTKALLVICLTSSLPAASIERALQRMYNADFEESDREMAAYVKEHPLDALGETFRAASYLFRELDRMKVLEAEFFASDRRLMEKKQLSPDPSLKTRFYAAIESSKRKAEARLAAANSDAKKDANSDRDSLFALCLNAGLITDYVGLIERRQIGSLSHAKESQAYAVRLLKLDPNFADAYLTTGLTEYFLGSVPFFVKWFVRFDDAQGDKKLAVLRLNEVVQKGRYLGPFAKILLAVIDLREKRLSSAEARLVELVRDFPENPLYKMELDRLRQKLK